MKPIRFRVWDGKTMHFVNPDSYLCIFNDPNKVAWRLYNVGADTLICDSILICDSQHDGVLMQFTGLLDRNGKEIYDGDVVTSWNLVTNSGLPATCIVKWDRNCWMIQRVDQSGMTGMYLPEDKKFGVEVIGNIYENPELLEKSN